jgi:hypothetical protein
MKSLDSLDVSTSGGAGEWEEEITGQHYDVSVSVDEDSLFLRVPERCVGHEQRGFHVHSTMQPEDCNQLRLHCAVESFVLR